MANTKLPPGQQERFDRILSIPENKNCFDCGARQPRWGSFSLGVLFCLRCAGVHRSLGVHITKVKSVNMDGWTEPQLLVVERIGNKNGKLLYEYEMPAAMRCTPQMSTPQVERVLRDKYEKKKYFHPQAAVLYEELINGNNNNNNTNNNQPTQNHNHNNNHNTVKSAPPAVVQPAVPVEELWGPAVTVSNHNHNNNNQNNNNNNRTNVSVDDLFSNNHYNNNNYNPSNNNNNNNYNQQTQNNNNNNLWQQPQHNNNNNNNNNKDEILSLFSSPQSPQNNIYNSAWTANTVRPYYGAGK